MSGKCSKEACYPDETGCNIEGHKYVQNCQFYNIDNQEEELEGNRDKEGKFINIPWTGNSFGLTDLNYLTARSSVTTIGVTGVANAGKTTFLATLYCLLRNGRQIGKYKFAGSLTLIGWENIAWYLSWNSHNYIQYPPHTSINSGRVPGLLHLALRNTGNGNRKDIIFTDAPGEWFDNWSFNKSDQKAQGAEWIYKNSDAFLLFADCEKLSSQEKGKARQQTHLVADRLNEDLQQRPLALIWAKSDITISDGIKDQISNHIKNKSPINYKEFQTSVKEGQDREFHNNILGTINWVFNVKNQYKKYDLTLSIHQSDDFFLSKR